MRETQRHWDYREQKWETEEGDTYEGDVDADGRFTAHLKLGEEHDDLKDQDYSRFKDLTYAAYFTDPTTNRTEQRRFDLRLTKDAIHVYVIDRGRQVRNFPLEFYVSTSYADGTPAPVTWPFRAPGMTRRDLKSLCGLSRPTATDSKGDWSHVAEGPDGRHSTFAIVSRA